MSRIVVVGGGAAGCVLASRLSEDPGIEVILVEAGKDIVAGQVPSDIDDTFPSAYANPDYFWPGLEASQISGAPARPYTQARLLGGGSSVMGMWALRGLPDDYDGWERSGCAGWSYSDVLPYFRKLEKDLDYQGPEHGHDGPIPVNRIEMRDWPLLDRTIAEGLRARGLTVHADINSTFKPGMYPIPKSTDRVRRVSSATAYLSAEVRRRPNLSILTDATVKRITFTGREVSGVELVAKGEARTIVSRHVVVAAGAIHTPNLLLRSGVGCAGTLASLGIDPVVDLPGVGRNLQNHCFVNFGLAVRRHARQPAAMRTYGVSCARLSTGLHDAPESDVLVSFIGRTGGGRFGNRIGQVGVCLYAPFSRGTVSVARNGNELRTLVDFSFFSDARDKDRMIHAAGFIRDLLGGESVQRSISEFFVLPPDPPVRLMNGPGLRPLMFSMLVAGVVDGPAALRRYAFKAGIGRGRHSSEISDPDYFRQLVTQSTTAMFHVSGTCAMGDVVLPDTRVKDVEGLYVADASIMPTVPRANTNIPTIMIGEKASDHIRSRIRGLR